jgi:carboxymethylenebutenolidase
LLKRKDTMTTQSVTIPALLGGSFSAYLAAPSSQPRAGIVLIQEVLGVNKNMRQIADNFAKAGYLVIVPDLYWRLEPDVQLDPDDEKHWAKAFELLGAFDLDSGVEDLKATLSFLRQYPSSTGKVGSVGFCLGGKLAYFMATRTDADANVSYYGIDIDKNLATIQQGLKDNPLVTIYRYEGVNHGFSRVGSSAYRKEAAELAGDRTLAFLKQHLGC